MNLCFYFFTVVITTAGTPLSWIIIHSYIVFPHNTVPTYLHATAVFCSLTDSFHSIVMYSGFSIHDGSLLHSRSQYTTVKHSQKLFEHTYTSDPHGLGTPTPIEFFQQDLLWQSSNTRSHSCSQKASKHTSGQSIVGLSVRLHTTTAPRRIVHH
jgi:hypothetical protein